MIKLKYSDEMKHIDKLWQDEKEDTLLMEEYFKSIRDEAISKGFKGLIDIYQGPGEAIADVYLSQEEKDIMDRDGGDVRSFGHCEPLIKELEKIMNKDFINKSKATIFNNMLIITNGNEIDKANKTIAIYLIEGLRNKEAVIKTLKEEPQYFERNIVTSNVPIDVFSLDSMIHNLKKVMTLEKEKELELRTKFKKYDKKDYDMWHFLIKVLDPKIGSIFIDNPTNVDEPCVFNEEIEMMIEEAVSEWGC